MFTEQSRRLGEWASGREWCVAWGPASVIDLVQREIEDRIDNDLDARFVREALPQFSFDLKLPSASHRVVLAVAKPRGAHSVRFTIDGREVDAIIPPTYVRYRPMFEEIRRELLDGPLDGARVEHLDVPLKLLSTRLGLVRYGRNNVTYADGIGSYLQLAAFVTDADLPVPADWQPAERRLLDECEGCSICLAVCPTAGIDDDRVLLHAERCLTFANENSAPLPASIPAGAHHTLVGCLQCQRLCPANPELTVNPTVALSEPETRAFLADDATSAPGRNAREKILTLGMSDISVLGRNLRALLAAAH